MNKLINIGILLLLVIFISFRVNVACNELNSDRSNSSGYHDLPVTFQGILPCESCPEIQYSLTLEEERYIEYSITLQEAITHHHTEGKWKLIADTLYIYDMNDSAVKKFLWRKDEIVLLSQDNSEIGSIAIEIN